MTGFLFFNTFSSVLYTLLNYYPEALVKKALVRHSRFILCVCDLSVIYDHIIVGGYIFRASYDNI